MFKSIQICRAVAAILVVLFHTGGALSSDKYFDAPLFGIPFSFGDSGVEFFFVLSGFIIAFVHRADFGNPKRLGSYLKKRIIRIYPTYLIIFTAVYLIALSSSSLRQTVPHDLLTILKSILLLPQDAKVSGGTGAPVLIVAWSLQYEMAFYMFVATIILNKRLGFALACLLFANYADCHFLNECKFPRSFLSDNLVLLFALGAAAARLCTSKLILSHPKRIAWIASITFLITGATEAIFGKDVLFVDRKLIYGLLSLIIIVAFVHLEKVGEWKAKWSWALLLGDASYSLYLLHYPIISVLCKIFSRLGLHGSTGALIAFLPIVAICLLAAVSFHWFIERPLLGYLSSKNAKQLNNLQPQS